LEDVDLKGILERNSECRSKEFQNFLTKYQLITGEIIRGSFYEVETYKRKVKELEKHCAELERKTELIFLNHKFNNEIVEDFIHFKKLAEVCSEVGGFYDPCKFVFKYQLTIFLIFLHINLLNKKLDTPIDRYDERINRKIFVNPNGILDMKKLTDDMRRDDLPRVKSLQNELYNLNIRYKNLKEDFELINLSNKELKNKLSENSVDKKESLDDEYSRNKELEKLNSEIKELHKKMESMIDKLKKLTEENKENEDEIKLLKEELIKYKEFQEKSKSNFLNFLIPSKMEAIELRGSVINV